MSLNTYTEASHTRGMSRPLSKSRVRRMLKWFRNKRVHVRYEYNDSMGWHQVRETCLTYDSFEVRGSGPFPYAYIVLTQKGHTVWEQELDEAWVFVGLGRLERVCGATCRFTMIDIDVPSP